MSFYLLPEGPVLATADQAAGADCLRLIAWKPETIPTLFPGVAARPRPDFPHQYIHVTTKREFTRAIKRSIASIDYASAEGFAESDDLYSVIADECLKFVASINWSTTQPSPDAPPAEEPEL